MFYRGGVTYHFPGVSANFYQTTQYHIPLLRLRTELHAYRKHLHKRYGMKDPSPLQYYLK